MEWMENGFEFDFHPFGGSPLYQALTLESEEQAFRILEELREPLPLQESAHCLRKALMDNSEALFRRILERSAVGEGTEGYFLESRRPGWEIRCHGSLLTLAAMMDRPRQAAALLEHGYDVNGSGLAVADTLRRSSRPLSDFAADGVRYCAGAGSTLQVIRPMMDDLGISCVTPLAAALLCGSLQTAEILLRWEGVWKGESSAVCRAAAIVLEGLAAPALPEERQRDQREILRRIFCPDRAELPDRRTFLRSVYLQPASFVDLCSSAVLKAQLESGFCTREDVRQMLEILSVHRWWRWGSWDRSKAGKLLALKQFFPGLCREGWVTGIFLQEILERIRNELPHKTMLNAWKQLCGKERDLTWASENLSVMTWKDLHGFLREAEEGGTLVMDADAMSRLGIMSPRSVGALLKRVRFRRRDGEGVSGLIQHLMMFGDLRLLRQAKTLGLLEQEDPKRLMECLTATENNRQDVRAMVLTFARNRPDPTAALADWRDPRRWNHWCLWQLLEEEEGQALLGKLLQGGQSRETCLRTLFSLYQFMKRGAFAPDLRLEHPQYPSLEADSLMAFACCGEDGQMMELLLEHWPQTAAETLRADWGKTLFFRGTPLALAAALGRTEQVRLLLDAGLDPDETGRGDVSRFFTQNPDFSEESVPVTPVLAAILFGEAQTAKLLLERGARCDFGSAQHLKVLMQGSAESLQLAQSLPDVGFERISPGDLAILRILTAFQGERTKFWNSLRRGSPV